MHSIHVLRNSSFLDFKDLTKDTDFQSLESESREVVGIAMNVAVSIFLLGNDRTILRVSM